MKWPLDVTLIRHGQSAYNVLREEKNRDPEYREFKRAFNRDHLSPKTLELAEVMRKRYALKTSDYGTPLTTLGILQGKRTGAQLHKVIPLPDVVLCSPYDRTVGTHRALCEGWPELSDVKCILEDRIREQEHGLSLLYSDWRLFHTFHPQQKELHDLLGPYWYQYPQGESVSEVRERFRDVLSMLIREYAGMRVLMVTHHLTILSARANIERLSPIEFIELDRHQKPINCGVTRYLGRPDLGSDGRLVLDFYNKKLY